jgi:hypothetical protein
MIQNLVVAIMVIAAAAFVARRYGPPWLARKLSAWLAATLAMFGLKRAAAALSREAPGGKSCGSGCGSCGACATPAVPATLAPGESVVKFHRR